MDRTMELIMKSHEGDRQARDQLIKENMGLVWNIARRFCGRGHELEDLFQIGSIGLMKAIDKFDLSFEVKFSTYAVPMITGEIKRFLRDDSMIKVSRSLKETAMKAKNAQENLANSLGREPTLEEISIEVGVSPEELVASLEAGASVESLYKTIYQGDGSSIYLIDKLDETECEDEEVLNRMVLKKLIEDLEPQEKQIIILRYFKDQTQTQIAKQLGISQVQVSRLEKRILKSMREKI
ncbi:RNA polymerase sigma factor [Clostridia bacterium]|nr:RNA polymerase sigma factor [Clostridia bacterium]